MAGRSRPQFPDHLDFQFAQFPVGNNQKVPTAAGGIEEFHIAESLVKGFQRGVAAGISTFA